MIDPALNLIHPQLETLLLLQERAGRIQTRVQDLAARADETVWLGDPLSANKGWSVFLHFLFSILAIIADHRKNGLKQIETK